MPFTTVLYSKTETLCRTRVADITVSLVSSDSRLCHTAAGTSAEYLLAHGSILQIILGPKSGGTMIGNGQIPSAKRAELSGRRYRQRTATKPVSAWLKSLADGFFEP